MSGPPDLSIIIPTRNRGALLQATLASACANAPEDVEVLVADNDDRGAPPIQAPDGRTSVLSRPEAPLPMSENWERALDQARGEWVMVLSDKYHLLPGAIAGLRRLASPDLEVVKYEVGFFQQSLESGRPLEVAALRGEPGHMLPLARGGTERCSTAPYLERYRTAADYQGDAPMLYNALVRRRLIDRVRRRTGRFFIGAAPDVSSAIQLAANAASFLQVGRAAVVAHHPDLDGTRWSNGVAVVQSSARARAFIAESAPGSALLHQLPALGISIMLETVTATLEAQGLLDPRGEVALWRRYVETALSELALRRERRLHDATLLARAARRRLGLRGLLRPSAQAGARLLVRGARGVASPQPAPAPSRLERVASLEAVLARGLQVWSDQPMASALLERGT